MKICWKCIRPQVFTLRGLSAVNGCRQNEMESCGLLVDYCDAFIICLDSHSYGTHSLQRIHWWASDNFIHFSKSALYILDCLRVSISSAIFHFWVNYSFNYIIDCPSHIIFFLNKKYIKKYINNYCNGLASQQHHNNLNITAKYVNILIWSGFNA